MFWCGASCCSCCCWGPTRTRRTQILKRESDLVLAHMHKHPIRICAFTSRLIAWRRRCLEVRQLINITIIRNGSFVCFKRGRTINCITHKCMHNTWTIVYANTLPRRRWRPAACSSGSDWCRYLFRTLRPCISRPHKTLAMSCVCGCMAVAAPAFVRHMCSRINDADRKQTITGWPSCRTFFPGHVSAESVTYASHIEDMSCCIQRDDK